MIHDLGLITAMILTVLTWSGTLVKILSRFFFAGPVHVFLKPTAHRAGDHIFIIGNNFINFVKFALIFKIIKLSCKTNIKKYFHFKKNTFKVRFRVSLSLIQVADQAPACSGLYSYKRLGNQYISPPASTPPFPRNEYQCITELPLASNSH